MSDSKCFCHFNGYEVKDAAARNLLVMHQADIIANGRKIDFLREELGAVIDPESVENINDVMGNGWYEYTPATEGIPDVFTEGVCEVSSYLGHKVFQTLRDLSGYVATRNYNYDTEIWSEWEYVVAPMLNGVEYRTTKRHNGKVVYSRTKDFVLSGKTSTGWQNGDNFDSGIPASAKIVSCYCNYLDDNDYTLCRQFPLFEEGAIRMEYQISNVEATLFPDQENNYLITVEGAQGVTLTGKVRIFVEYTK